MSPQARDEWRSGWPVVLVSCLGMLLISSYLYTFGVFLPQIERATGWSRSQVTAGLLIVSCISVVLAPGAGYLIDRFGPRALALPGVALYCAGLALLSQAGASALSWWGLWMVVALGSVCIKPTVWTAAIGILFSSSRGLAFALALSGAGFGGAFLPSLTAELLVRFDWRTSYAILGLGAGAIMLPMTFLFFRADPDATTRAHRRSLLNGLPPRAAFRSTKYLRLALTGFLATATATALTVHFVPMMVFRGHSSVSAAQVAGLIGLASMAGRLVTGFLLDRVDGRLVGAVALGLPALACFLLLQFAPSQTQSALAALIIGVSLGAEIDIMAYLCSRHFGMKNFGLLFGSIAGLISFGGGVGPWAASLIFDYSGSYHLLWLILIAASSANLLMVATIGRYPVFDPPGADALAARG
jgi:MFS family permease